MTDKQELSGVVAWRWRWGKMGSNLAWKFSTEKPGPFPEEGYEVKALYLHSDSELAKVTAERDEAREIERKLRLSIDYLGEQNELHASIAEKALVRAEAAESLLASRTTVIEAAIEAMEPFAMTAEQMDRELPGARNGRVTIVHPLEDVFPALYGWTDHECPDWPLPDDLSIIDAWRYHDPVPASEHMGVQMRHLRATRSVLAQLRSLIAGKETT